MWRMFRSKKWIAVTEVELNYHEKEAHSYNQSKHVTVLSFKLQNSNPEKNSGIDRIRFLN